LSGQLHASTALTPGIDLVIGHWVGPEVFMVMTVETETRAHAEN